MIVTSAHEMRMSLKSMAGNVKHKRHQQNGTIVGVTTATNFTIKLLNASEATQQKARELKEHLSEAISTKFFSAENQG